MVYISESAFLVTISESLKTVIFSAKESVHVW